MLDVAQVTYRLHLDFGRSLEARFFHTWRTSPILIPARRTALGPFGMLAYLSPTVSPPVCNAGHPAVGYAVEVSDSQARLQHL